MPANANTVENRVSNKAKRGGGRGGEESSKKATTTNIVAVLPKWEQRSDKGS